MKKLILLLPILLLIFVAGCQAKAKEQDKDFNFIFKYGQGMKNSLNTFEGTYEKDLGTKGVVKTKIVLTEDEMRQIRQEMITIAIMQYDRVFMPAFKGIKADPHPTYYLKVKLNGTFKEITWEDDIDSDDPAVIPPEALSLRNLFQKIIMAIESKEEYK